MKTKFTPTDPVRKYPCFRKWTCEDGFKGSIVVFDKEQSFTVLHVETPSDTPRTVGEHVEDDYVSSDDSNAWESVSGVITITIP